MTDAPAVASPCALPRAHRGVLHGHDCEPLTMLITSWGEGGVWEGEATRSKGQGKGHGR